MLDAGGGGGYSGTTNWYAHDVESMWGLLSNQETSNHWRQVSGWDKIAELTSTHLYRLKQYRDNLAAAWPPGKNAAAKAFIDRLDYLIAHVESINEVASTNYSTFSTATSTISTSRYELKKIYDEYLKKKQQKQAYEEDIAFSRNSLLPGVNSGLPKVTQADLDVLNNEARGIMYELSGTLVQAQAQIKQPPPYKPPAATREDLDPNTYNSQSSPIIPPLVPIPSNNPVPASPPAPVSPVGTPNPPGMGPILGGTGPVLAPPAPPAPIPPSVITPTPMPPPTGLPPTVLPTPLPPGPGLPAPPPVTSNGNGSIRPGTGGTTNLPKAMPPGGLIGGKPGTGLDQPASVRPTQRINPVGGVIGNGGGMSSGRGAIGARPGVGLGSVNHAAGSTNVTSSRGPIGVGGHRPSMTISSSGQGFGSRHSGRQRDDEKSAQTWDPDNPWETDEGVAPVVLPPAEPGRIDPGPMIGFNR